MSLSEDSESSNSSLENVNEIDDAKNERDLDRNKNPDYSPDYNFGWNRYCEIINGRFAMIGFLSILIIEILSKQSFFSWAAISN